MTQLPPSLLEEWPCAHAALFVAVCMAALAVGSVALGWLSEKIREKADDEGEPTTYEEEDE